MDFLSKFKYIFPLLGVALGAGMIYLSVWALLKYRLRLFGYVGMIFLAIGFLMCLWNLWFLAASKTAVGTIVDYSTTAEGMHRPIVEFSAQNGQVYKIVSAVGTAAKTSSVKSPTNGVLEYEDPFKKELGKKVKVRYLPNKPSHAQISTFFELWLGALTFLLFGLAGLGISYGGNKIGQLMEKVKPGTIKELTGKLNEIQSNKKNNEINE